MTMQQVTPDKKKAENLFHNAGVILQSVEIRRESSEAIFILKEEYEILHLLASAILAIEGEKIRDVDHHKALIARIIEKYSEGAKYSNKEKRLHYPAEAIQMFDNKSPQLYKQQLTAPQTRVWEELRKIRNDINYYGQKDKATLQDFYERNKETIISLREKLFVILKEKLKKK